VLELAPQKAIQLFLSLSRPNLFVLEVICHLNAQGNRNQSYNLCLSVGEQITTSIGTPLTTFFSSLTVAQLFSVFILLFNPVTLIEILIVVADAVLIINS